MDASQKLIFNYLHDVFVSPTQFLGRRPSKSGGRSAPIGGLRPRGGSVLGMYPAAGPQGPRLNTSIDRFRVKRP
jgi:hypothetical protein